MHQVNIEEAQSQLPELINAAISGEEIVITRDNRPIVKLIPISRTMPRPQFGSARGLIEMSDDFDAPLADFAEYLK